MTEAKRGRPALPDEQKRQQIGVRTSPALKAVLEKAASDNGRSVAQEAEWRLQRTFEEEERAGGDHSASLLRIVSAEIEKIETITGKRWSKDLKTWAAVARMFAYGPIRELRPDRTSDDDIVMSAWNKLYGAQQEKKAITEEMSAAGFAVSPDLPEKSRLSRRRGMFGVGGGGLLGQYASGGSALDVKREAIRKYITDVADAGIVDQLLAMLDRVVELDEIERAADKEWTEASKPYHDAEAEGAKLFQDMMDRRAQERFARGDYSLMGEPF